MSYNPFEAPATNSRVVGIVSGSREDLLKVAKYQKGILVCILVYILAVAGQFALPPQIRPLVGLGVLVVGLIAAIFTILLAMKTHGTGLGIILASTEINSTRNDIGVLSASALFLTTIAPCLRGNFVSSSKCH